jgi:SAM-dependent methyltransferase
VTSKITSGLNNEIGKTMNIRGGGEKSSCQSKTSTTLSSEDAKKNTAKQFLFRLKAWLSRPLSDKIYYLIYLCEYAIFYSHGIRGYDFGGNISNKELVTEFKNTSGNATAYEQSSIHVINDILEEIRLSGFKFSTFLDVGCGKGFVCIYVAKKLDVLKIIGFDFSKPLIDVALSNLVKSKYKKISFTVDNAAKYLIPDGDTLVFLFNPFDGSILNEFIKNNIDHFLQNKSVIAYSYDDEKQILLNSGFEIIYRSQRTKTSIWKHSGIKPA